MEFKQGRELKEFEHLYKLVDELYHEISLAIGISDTAFIILYCMMELGDDCTQKSICNMYSVSKQTINSSIQSLEKDGLITRTKHGRDVFLSFTEKGIAFSKKHIGPVFILENQVFDEMDLKDRKELLRLTKKYVSSMEAKTKDFLSNYNEE